IKATKGGYELRRAAARASAEAGDLVSARNYLEELMPEIGERTDIIQLYGDVMLRVGEAEEAKDHLLPAVDRLLRAGDVARAATLVKRLLRSAPTDIDVLSRADRVFERLGDQDMVVNIELALAEAFIRAGRQGEAIDVHKRLVRRNPSDPEVTKRLGGLAEALGLSPAQRAGVSPFVPQAAEPAAPAPPPTAPRPAPTPAADEISVEFIDVELEPDSGPAETVMGHASPDIWAAPTVVPTDTPLRFDAPLPEEPPLPVGTAPSPADELLTEAQVFAKYGLIDKAIAHLHRLLAQFPDHQPAQELLGSLGGAVPGDASDLQPPLASAIPAPALATELPPPADPSQIEHVAGFDSPWVPAPLTSEPSIDSAAVIPDEPLETLPTVAAPIASEPPPPPVGSASQLDIASLGLAPTPAPRFAPTHQPATASGLSLDDLVGSKHSSTRSGTARPVKMEALEAMLGLPTQAQQAHPARPRGAARAEDVQLDLGALGLPAVTPRKKGPELSAAAAEQAPARSRAASPAETPTPPTEISEPLLSDAPAPSTMSVAAVPVEPPSEIVPVVVELPTTADSSPAPLPAAPEPPPAPAVAPEDVDVLEAPIDLVEVSEILAGPSPEQLGELDFFIQQGLLDEAAKLLGKLREGFPDHPEVRSRHALLKARGWDEEKPQTGGETSASELFSEEEQFFDLAAELEKELAEDELVAEATGVGKGGEASIEELFREFQRGVAEQIQDQDYDTHFNLGLAYREMGLLDEAIGEFQLALRSPLLFIEGASMIGACYMEKALPEQAAEWYARGLTAPGLSPETVLGLRYELGRAQEAAGREAEALGNFTEVLTVNPGFRDVVDRVSRLRAH
ncbi:MAG TPA: tetratricopeptide repeat protein, partial [Thermoanaerobaculaceae bacterium]|nr:tetratricopeptide repeat protein [Thermoanaerobaculaceae bacterium]